MPVTPPTLRRIVRRTPSRSTGPSLRGRARGLATGLLTVVLGACAAPPPQAPAPMAPAAAAASPLRGTTWLLAAKADSTTPADGSKRRGPFLQFDPQTDRYSGHSGCNRLMGRYTLEGSSLRLLNGASTRMACLEEARMQQEQAFIAALAQVQAWRVQGTQLQLLGAGSQVLLTLQDSAAAPAPAGKPAGR